jgi:DNA/RNA-binding domain of Phe-tRNA-synthetase-like protein
MAKAPSAKKLARIRAAYQEIHWKTGKPRYSWEQLGKKFKTGPTTIQKAIEGLSRNGKGEALDVVNKALDVANASVEARIARAVRALEETLSDAGLIALEINFRKREFNVVRGTVSSF